jgi:hypothetical protein
MTRQWKIQSLAVGLIVAFVVVSVWAPALAMEDQWDAGRKDLPSTPGMMFDLVFARPFGIAATGIGAAFFFVSLPFSALGGNSDLAFKRLVVAPAQFTFVRPLGGGSQPDPP